MPTFMCFSLYCLLNSPKTGHWRKNSTQSFPWKTKKLAKTIEQIQLVNMKQQGTTNQQTNLHITLQCRKLSSCSSFTSKRELHDASIATRCLGIKIQLLVKLEKRDSGRHGFSIGSLAHQILHEIENFWAVIKRRIKLHRPQNVYELEYATQAEWQFLTSFDLLPYIELASS